MAKNIEKNPFSLYDFLGHFIPGALFLIIFFTMLQGYNESDFENFSTLKFYDISTYTHLLKGISNFNMGFISVSFILSAYISGNVISYISSQTIEKILTRMFGYPSKWLLEKEDHKKCIWKNYFNINRNLSVKAKLGLIFLLIVNIIITFPVCLLISICEMSFEITKYITNPLDDKIISAIKNKEELLAKKLLIDDYSKINDFHRVIMHYVYMNLEKSDIKTDNYIALYGFFRSITLILCLYFDFLVVMGIKSITYTYNTIIDFQSIIFIATIGMLSFIIFMAFVKFYRRFTLENYMMLLCDTNIT